MARGTHFGGQLRRLKLSLSNPLEQITGICFVGDSITLGRDLVANSIITPHAGELEDPRNNSTDGSWVNIFKKYIQDVYFDEESATPSVTNWSTSISGESIITYSREHVLFPLRGLFKHAMVGKDLDTTEYESLNSVTNRVMSLRSTADNNDYHSIRFTFTGDEFDLRFHSVNSNSMDYDIYIDGCHEGTYNTQPNIDGVVVGTNQSRIHNIGYVREAEIEIRSRRVSNTLTQSLRLEGLIVNKKVSLSNQGIRGKEVDTYIEDIMPYDPFRREDNYIFVCLGVNDRKHVTEFVNGVDGFRENLQDLVGLLKPLADVILINPNRCKFSVNNLHSFTSSQVRDVVVQVASSNDIDNVDNFSLFSGMDFLDYTTDYLHPNEVGHAAMGENLIAMFNIA